jgi:hypothetical protein
MKPKNVKLWLLSLVIIISLITLLALNWPFHKKVIYKFPLDKATAQIVATEKVKSEFIGAKLIQSSDSVDNKAGLHGWIFVYQSKGIFGWNKHSAAIMVDINTGETLVQRAY